MNTIIKRSAYPIAGILATLLFGAALTGCPDYSLESGWSYTLNVDAPLRMGDDLIYINRSVGELVRVSATRVGEEPTLEVTRAELGDKPGAVAASADGKSLYVVNVGERTLSIVTLGEELSAKKLKLSSAYNKIDVDPAGEFLLLSFSNAAIDDPRQQIARNLNEVGIVDLRVAEPAAVFVTLASRARQFVFAPPFALGGQRQRFVAALADSEVTLLDLLADNPDDRLREVPLTLTEAEAVRRPIQAIFDITPSDELPDTGLLYVLTESAADITQVSIQPSNDPDARLKLDLSVNQLAAGSNPGQMALLELPQGERLLALDRSSPRFTLVDTTSGEGATFDLPIGAPGVTLTPYKATPRTGVMPAPEVRVLVTSPFSTLVAVIRPETIAIAGDQPTLGRSVNVIRLEANPQKVQINEGGGLERAIVFHPGIQGGFSVLNLREDRDIPIQGQSLRDIQFSGDIGVGLFNGASYLGVFELDTGHPNVFDLPKPGQYVAVDEADSLIVVQHEDVRGRFTVLDANDPTPGAARVFRDVFIDGLFDKELP
jgi:hypothetical protein